MALEALWRELPSAVKSKAACTDRHYYADADGWFSRRLSAALLRATSPIRVSAVAPLLRFLHYPFVGGSLPPHVDLSRKVALHHGGATAATPTTHSFLLYLSDSAAGGETVLLEALPGDAALAHRGGVAPGERAALAAVRPRRGRLLLMPHACPHLAAPVVEAPKILIRGELIIEATRST